MNHTVPSQPSAATATPQPTTTTPQPAPAPTSQALPGPSSTAVTSQPAAQPSTGISHLEAIVSQHGSGDASADCIYMHFFLGVPKVKPRHLHSKSTKTITSQIKQFKDNHSLSRKISTKTIFKKLSTDKYEWIVELYKKEPLLFLQECKARFESKFKQYISTSMISSILQSANMTWKALERRAKQISTSDVIRFSLELCRFDWLLMNLVFLDEVSFDNRDMVRERGFGFRENALVYRGEYVQKPRFSLLCFIGLNGLLETYMTEGTFTRTKFTEFCIDFAKSGQVYQFPGPHSLWILDGARIHCDPNIVVTLRLMGIRVIFLPEYCPFFNPIEYVFGAMKRRLQALCSENPKEDMVTLVGTVLQEFTKKGFEEYFRKCGYTSSGFDPAVAYSTDQDNFRPDSDVADSTDLSELGFETIDSN